jgi:hypothetical protein
MPLSGLEPAIQAIKRPQTYALDRAAIAAEVRGSRKSDRWLCKFI